MARRPPTYITRGVTWAPGGRARTGDPGDPKMRISAGKRRTEVEVEAAAEEPSRSPWVSMEEEEDWDG